MLAVRRELIDATLDVLRTCGGGLRECVVLWLAPNTVTEWVDEVVHPTHAATPWSYELDDAWLHHFWGELERRERSVRAQVHTHGGRAGHSPTDDTYPIVHVPGFRSLVIPDFAEQVTDLGSAYLAVIDGSGVWRGTPIERSLQIET